MTEKQIMTDVLIVGAGTAGLTAAVYAARAGKSVKLVEQYCRRQIINASHVEISPALNPLPALNLPKHFIIRLSKWVRKRLR